MSAFGAQDTEGATVFQSGELRADPGQPRHFLTEPGIGYWLQAE
jgi:hypothetical protein